MMAAGARRLKGTFPAKFPDSPRGLGSSRAAGLILPVLMNSAASSSAWDSWPGGDAAFRKGLRVRHCEDPAPSST